MYSSFIFTEDRLEIKLNALKDEKGIIWFIGKEVAEILEYADSRTALRRRVDEDDKKILTSGEIITCQNDTFDIPNRGLSIVNECGFYSLVLGSKKPEAKLFKKWVTKEVLPSLRKKQLLH